MRCYLKQRIQSTERPPRSSKFRIVIVGPGRVGQTLGRLLSDRHYPVLAVVGRNPAKAVSARRFIRALKAATELNEEIFEPADVVFVTTPDQVIAETAQALAALDLSWRGKTVFHTSGALTSRELAPLRRRGATVASLHPLQTFPSPSEGIRKVRGIFYTFEGDPKALRVAQRLVQDLGGRMVSIPARYKPLYHCAGTFACGGLLAPLSIAYALYRKIGIEEQTARAMLQPMVDATMEGGQQRDLHKTITGPISRGDAKTVEAHLNSLLDFAPQFLEMYKHLSMRLLELATPRIASSKAREIKRLLTRSTQIPESKI